VEDVFILSAVRTPIGKYGGGLASVPPCDLAAKVVREAVSRSGVEPGGGQGTGPAAGSD
jgi:acetyl-CoA C-acetyltransferase